MEEAEGSRQSEGPRSKPDTPKAQGSSQSRILKYYLVGKEGIPDCTHPARLEAGGRQDWVLLVRFGVDTGQWEPGTRGAAKALLGGAGVLRVETGFWSPRLIFTARRSPGEGLELWDRAPSLRPQDPSPPLTSSLPLHSARETLSSYKKCHFLLKFSHGLISW